MTDKEKLDTFESCLKLNVLQRQMIDNDKLLIQKAQKENIIPKNNRTIAQEEELIINKYNGRKISLHYFYNNLSNFFGNTEDMAYAVYALPCNIYCGETDEIIPDEYFYSFYAIPLPDEITKNNQNSGKELLIFVSSQDSQNIYVANILNYAALEHTECEKEFNAELCYYQDGIVVFYEDIVDD
jgi:hypothetical protein